MDYSIRIGGEAGQGIQTVGDTLSRVFARTGYQVFTHQDYESRVRGGHNFYHVRFADRQLTAARDRIDILVAFDRDSMDKDAAFVSEQGQIIYDSAALKQKFDGRQFLDIPFAALSIRAWRQQNHGQRSCNRSDPGHARHGPGYSSQDHF